MKRLAQKASAGLGMLVMLSFGFGSAFAADGDSCTAISSVPITISKAGVYCMNTDITTSSASGITITVASDNVTIDLDGHTLNNLAAGTQATGIGFSHLQTNTTVRNGTVRGFGLGINLAGSGALIENIRADSNGTGIAVSGAGAVVRNNQVVSSGIDGIDITGTGSRVLNNDVVDFGGKGIGAYGSAAGSSGFVVEGNRLSTNVNALDGIDLSSTNNPLVVNNRVIITKGGWGLFSPAAVILRDNIFLTANCYEIQSTVTDLGNNQCVP